MKTKNILILVIVLLLLIFLPILFFYYPDNSQPTFTYQKTTQFSETRIVVADKDFSPYSFIDEQGFYTGHDVELISKLAEMLQFNIDLQLLPWTECNRKIQEGEADYILGIVLNPNSKSNTFFSQPISADEFVIFGKEKYGSETLYEKKIAYLSGSDAYNSIIIPFNFESNATQYETYGEAFESVEKGINDYVLASYSVGRMISAKYKDIKAYGSPLLTKMFAIGISENKNDTIPEINNALIQLRKEGYLDALNNKWLGNYIEVTTFSESLYYYRFIIFFILLLIAISFIITIIIFTKKKKDALDAQINLDSLTGLITRHKFNIEAKKILEFAKPNEYLLIAIDIDNFKHINKLYGYSEGNNVLLTVTRVLKDHIAKNGLFARENNDNFVMLIKNTFNGTTICGRSQCIKCIPQKIQHELANKTIVNISKGLYIIKDPSIPIDYMIDCARTAKTQGKKIYGSTLIEFTQEMQTKFDKQNLIVANMEVALQNREFFLVIQPKVDLHTNKIIGGEALIRWKTKDNESIYPDEFIKVFESNGFIAKIDRYIFETMCFIIKNNPFLPVISVNLSPITLLQSDVVNDYMKILKKYDLTPETIEIEITETALSDDIKDINNFIEELKSLGFKISIDDFGTGISTLSRLHEMNIDVLKLDRSFITTNLAEEKTISILQSIFTISKTLNLRTVAEGIETNEQRKKLIDLGCDIGQGYFFSRPIEVLDFIELVNKN